MAQLLIEKEVIFAEDVERIFGKRPWASRSEEIMALKEEQEAAKAKQAEQAHTEEKKDNGETHTEEKEANQLNQTDCEQ